MTRSATPPGIPPNRPATPRGRTAGSSTGRRPPHPGDPPASGGGSLLHQPVQRADDVAGAASGDGVAHQGQGARLHLALEELGDQALAWPRSPGSRSTRAASQRRRGGDDAGRIGTTRPPCLRAERCESVSKTARGDPRRAGGPAAGPGAARLVLALGGAVGLQGAASPAQPPPIRGHATGRRGEGGRPPGRLGHPALEQVRMIAARAEPGHGGVREGGVQERWRQHEALDRGNCGCHPGELLGIERPRPLRRRIPGAWVHGRAPEPLAVAPASAPQRGHGFVDRSRRGLGVNLRAR